MKQLIVLTIVFILFISVSATAKGIVVSQKEYGKKWPFTVSKGVLECRRVKDVVLTTPDGKTYAINGKAIGSKKYRGLMEIWRDDPEFEGFKIAIPGDIIEKGLKLCR